MSGGKSHLVYVLAGGHAVGSIQVSKHVLEDDPVLSGWGWPRQGHSQGSALIQGEDGEFRNVRFGRCEDHNELQVK